MLYVAGIIGYSIVDGPGMRVSVFFQGCPHHCKGCHNKETWPFYGGKRFGVKDLLNEVKKYKSCKGITLSGGEPFSQNEKEIGEFVSELKKLGYEIAAYTGYTFEELYNSSKERNKILEKIDILIDGKFIQEQLSLDLMFRGSKNQRILNTKESLKKGCAVKETSTRWVGE